MKITLTSILALVAINCAEKSESKVEKINPAELQKGTIQRENLSEEQLQRIDKIREIFAEIGTQSREQWIDNFKRDVHPDKEIRIWEPMAKAYQTYCSKNNLPKAAKKEVFQIILVRSMAVGKEEMLKSIKLKELTEREAKEVIDLY